MEVIRNSGQQIEVTTQTNEGHFFIGGTADALGPGIRVIFIESVLDAGVQDIHLLGLKRFSILQVLGNLP